MSAVHNILRDAQQRADLFAAYAARALRAPAVDGESGHRDIVGMHAMVWSDIYRGIAHAGDDLDLVALHNAAAADADADLDPYVGYDAGAWIELWRFFIHDHLPEPARQPWLRDVAPLAGYADMSVWLPRNLNPFSADETIVTTRARFLHEEEELRRDAARLLRVEVPAAAAERAREADRLFFYRWLLDRSEKIGDTLYMQAAVLAGVNAVISASQSFTGPHRDDVVKHRGQLVWIAPALERDDLLQRLPALDW